MAAADVTPGYDRMKEAKEFDESKIGVKALSDSGITSIPKFFVYPPEFLSDLKSSSSPTTGIPVIDLSNFNSAIHRPKIIEQIQEAASDWGFFQVINHGIPLSVLDETTAAIKAFHDQPTETKAKLYGREDERLVKYIHNNDLYKSKAASWHDSIQVLMMVPEMPPPVEEIPEICRREVVAWVKHATKVAENVGELLSEGLGLEAGKLKDLKLTDSKYFVGTIYPYCPQPDLTMGITSHTDAGILTVLLPNQVPGLQVKHGDEWVDVKPAPGGLIINVGDFLQIVSNGKYQSVEHRVLANSSNEARTLQGKMPTRTAISRSLLAKRTALKNVLSMRVLVEGGKREQLLAVLVSKQREQLVAVLVHRAKRTVSNRSRSSSKENS